MFYNPTNVQFTIWTSVLVMGKSAHCNQAGGCKIGSVDLRLSSVEIYAYSAKTVLLVLPRICVDPIMVSWLI